MPRSNGCIHRAEVSGDAVPAVPDYRSASWPSSPAGKSRGDAGFAFQNFRALGFLRLEGLRFSDFGISACRARV